MRPLVESGPEPISSAAVTRGGTYHGKPCKKAGHTLRYLNGGTCVECARAYAIAQKAKKSA